MDLKVEEINNAEITTMTDKAITYKVLPITTNHYQS
jgi:hypothetical protein